MPDLDATSPDFDRVQRETGTATRDAVALTWLELQEERLRRLAGDQALGNPLNNWIDLAGVFTGGNE